MKLIRKAPEGTHNPKFFEPGDYYWSFVRRQWKRCNGRTFARIVNNSTRYTRYRIGRDREVRGTEGRAASS